MSDGNKVLTLKDEGSPAPPPPDPPVPVTKKLKKLAVFASVTVGLFSAVFCCAGSALYMATPTPEPIIRGGSMVLLPVEPSSTANDGAAQALTEVLVTQLSGVAGLDVRPLETTRKLTGDQRKANVIGQELGVDYVLQPSYSSAGGRGELTAVLVNVKANGVVLSESYKRPDAELFGAVDSTVVAVAKATNLEDVSGASMARPVDDATMWTRNANAAYVCAHPPQGDTQQDALMGAVATLDGLSAPGWAAPKRSLMSCWKVLGETGAVKAKDAQAKGKAAAEAALALEPALAQDADFAAAAQALGVVLTAP